MKAYTKETAESLWEFFCHCSDDGENHFQDLAEFADSLPVPESKTDHQGHKPVFSKLSVLAWELSDYCSDCFDVESHEYFKLAMMVWQEYKEQRGEKAERVFVK